MTEILSFLQDLSANNHRDWMAQNKKRYEAARGGFLHFLDEVLQELKLADPSIAHLQAKECVFRINRDVRFSNDKSPYKTNFAAYLCVEGRKSFAPGYYLHIQPGQSFIAGGIYMPQGEWLKKIRQEIDYNPEPLLSFLQKEESFFGQLEGDKLQRAPKGYGEDHPNIGLLKLKSFLVQKSFSDAELADPHIGKKMAGGFIRMIPLIAYLKEAIETEDEEKFF